MITMKYSFNLKGESDWMVVNVPDERFIPRKGDLVRHTITTGDSIVEIKRRVKDIHRISIKNSCDVTVLVILEDEEHE